MYIQFILSTLLLLKIKAVFSTVLFPVECRESGNKFNFINRRKASFSGNPKQTQYIIFYRPSRYRRVNLNEKGCLSLPCV